MTEDAHPLEGREEFLGWVWIALGGLGTLVFPVWLLLSAVIAQLNPELLAAPSDFPTEESSPSPFEALTFGGFSAARLLLYAAPLAVVVGLAGWGLGWAVSRRRVRARAALDRTVAADAVLEDGELRVDSAGSRAIEGVPRSAPRERTPVSLHPDAASPWVRLAGMFIDAVPLILFCATAFASRELAAEIALEPGLVSSLPSSLFWGGAGVFAVALLLQTIFVLLSRQTVGQRMVGVRVVKAEADEPVLASVHLIRSLGLPYLAIVVPVFGWIALLIDVGVMMGDDRRGLRDLVTNTKVVEAG